MNDTKTLGDMAAEVDAYCQEKGWRENPVTFGEAMALLHSEVSEALEAWRTWGLTDGTAGSAITPGGDPGAKPEGVGSEFADILIRWLDDCALFGIDPDAAVGRLQQGWYALNKRFGENIDTLHVLISRASEAHASDGQPEDFFIGVYRYLWQLSEHYGIDLFAEYERKMTFNRTRAYKHGGRTI